MAEKYTREIMKHSYQNPCLMLFKTCYITAKSPKNNTSIGLMQVLSNVAVIVELRSFLRLKRSFTKEQKDGQSIPMLDQVNDVENV